MDDGYADLQAAAYSSKILFDSSIRHAQSLSLWEYAFKPVPSVVCPRRPQNDFSSIPPSMRLSNPTDDISSHNHGEEHDPKAG